MLSVIEEYTREIVEALQNMNPIKVILFGSYAKGNVDADSDIDLVVILDEDHIPTTYDEKLDMRVAAITALVRLNQRVPIDVIVYTKAEYQELMKTKGTFLTELSETGKTIYEKAG